MKYTSIAVGADGSETALYAVRRAASLAAAYEAKLVIICAYNRNSHSVLSSPTIEGTSAPVVGDQTADEYLKEAEAVALDEGAKNVVLRKVPGSPVNVLTETCLEEGAEVLVLGNQGIRSFSGRIFGNIPTGVARRSPVDVMIVNTQSAVS